MRAEGEWTQHGAPAVLAQAEAYAAAGEIDMAGIQRIDSAGLALMLELTRRAQRRGASLRFGNAPAQLAMLANFFELEGILTLNSRPT